MSKPQVTAVFACLLVSLLALPARLEAQDLGKVPVRGMPETTSTGQPARIQDK
jgi:hypothetical protein